jgi:hypothetical protein
MSRLPHGLRWIGSGCAAAGAALVLVGTYLVPWISVSAGVSFAIHSDATLFQLRSYRSCTGFINSTTQQTTCTNLLVNTASAWMTVIVVVLVAGAIVLATSRRRGTTHAACAVLGVASVLAILLAMHISVPTFSVHGPPSRIDLRQGRWICVAGGVLGLAACVLAFLAVIAPVSASNDVGGEPLSVTSPV